MRGKPTGNLRLTFDDWRKRLSVEEESVKSSQKLGEFFRVHRGTATGANEFFILSEQEARTSGIPESELVPVVRTLSPRPSKEKLGLLWRPSRQVSLPSLLKIERGVERGFQNRYLCRTRKPWWLVRTTYPPDWILSYMGRGKPILVRNDAGLLHLNNSLGLYRTERCSEEIEKSIVRWLQSAEGAAALLKCARHYQGGLWKLEPKDAEALEVSLALE